MAGHWLGLTRRDATTGALAGTQISKSHVVLRRLQMVVDPRPEGVIPSAAVVLRMRDSAEGWIGSRQVCERKKDKREETAATRRRSDRR